jgi:MFS family permease
MESLSLVAVFLGGGLAIVFILFTTLLYWKARPERKKAGEPRTVNPLPRKTAGVISILVGLILLFTWIYSFREGSNQMTVNSRSLIFNAVLMCASAISMIIAGVSMINNWAKSAYIFGAALLITSFSTITSLLENRDDGQPILMNGIAVAAVIVLVYFVGLSYFFEHFIFRLDTQNRKRRQN